MSPAITKIINFQDLVSSAIQETLAMSERGIDISDPSVITPLEWTANQYPEIARECNQSLLELVNQKMNSPTEQEPTEITNHF